MIEIDGASGGGQILRISAALSALTGKPFRILNIRGARKVPGIRPQHLAAVKAVARLSNAELIGASVGSSSLEFTPGSLSRKKLKIDIGTAGSITLVLQALMIVAMEKGCEFELTGGTDVSWSPPFDYLAYVTLPLLSNFGYRAKINLEKRGFYPKGGGRISGIIEPSELEEFNLVEPGKVISVSGRSVCGSLPEHVSRRQAVSASKALFEDNIVNAKISSSAVNTLSPGSVITLWSETDRSVLGSGALGKKGTEDVGRKAAEGLMKEISSPAAVDVFMGDQIIPYLAFAGGSVTIPEVTEHVESCVRAVNCFMEDSVRLEKGNPNILRSKRR